MGKMIKLPLFIAVLAVVNSAFADFTVLTSARQTVYQDGVPHTNRNGAIRTVYDPNISFFPRILYHPRVNNDMAGGTIGSNPTRFDLISKAGFNTIHMTQDLNETFFNKLAEYNMQLIYCPARAADAVKWSAYKSRILGWDIFDDVDIVKKIEDYLPLKTGIQLHDATTPCFATTTSENIHLQPSREKWIQWHQASDISSHWNYPYHVARGSEIIRPQSLSYNTGIPESVSLAVSCTNQAKPVWLIVPAFSGNTTARTYFYPTGDELRAMVYAGIVHGAVGISFFTYDNYVTREAEIIGISPAPSANYGTGRVATAEELNAIVALWNDVASINQELTDLEPWLLSPTSSIDYTVSKEGTAITTNPIRCILKNYNGKLRLIAVNIDRVKLNVRFDFANSGINISTGDRLYRDQASIELNSTILQDSFGPMEVKVYSLHSYSSGINGDGDIEK